MVITKLDACTHADEARKAPKSGYRLRLGDGIDHNGLKG
jgi:hypothetical protein